MKMTGKEFSDGHSDQLYEVDIEDGAEEEMDHLEEELPMMNEDSSGGGG